MVSPFQKYNSENKERWTVLIDIPDWISDDVARIITSLLFSGNGSIRKDVVASIQRKYRTLIEEILPGSTDDRASMRYLLNDGFKNGDERSLLMLEMIVMYVRDIAPEHVPIADEEILDKKLLNYLDKLLENGSKWKVNFKHNDNSGLTERVDSGLVQIAEESKEPHLTRAWNYAFQIQPDSEKAIEQAQKAIEACASDANLTNLTTSVYGGIIGDIKSNPTLYQSVASDAFRLHDELNKKENHINEDFAIWIAKSMDLIQKTNPAHHRSKVVKDFVLNPDAAQQAVVMATMVCWLIKKGYFVKIKR